MAHIGLAELLIVTCMLLFFVLLGAVAILVLARVVFGWGTRPCPYCAERIRHDAAICRYCGRDVSTGMAGTASEPVESTGTHPIEEQPGD
jgi:hypothetical protein